MLVVDIANAQVRYLLPAAFVELPPHRRYFLGAEASIKQGVEAPSPRGGRLGRLLALARGRGRAEWSTDIAVEVDPFLSLRPTARAGLSVLFFVIVTREPAPHFAEHVADPRAASLPAHTILQAPKPGEE